MSGYQYRGSRGTLTDDEVRARVQAARLKAAGNGAPAEESTAAQKAPSPEPVKGAVKVDAFPDTSRYPWQTIADDGGVWKLDPADYKAKPQSVRQAAAMWGSQHGCSVKTVVADGMVYVQFTWKAAP